MTHVFSVADPGAAPGSWAIRVVGPGERFGVGDVLLNDGADHLVEVYDPRFGHSAIGRAPGGEELSGQFVSRYRLPDIMSADHHGLNLEGGVAAWKMSGEALAEVLATVTSLTGKERAVAHRLRLDGMSRDEACDAVADALHEAADKIGIPEGEERDAWRLARMEDHGVDPRDDSFTARAAEMIAAIEHLREAPAADDDQDPAP